MGETAAHSGFLRVPKSACFQSEGSSDRNPVSPRLEIVTLTANQCKGSPLALAPKIPFRPIDLQQHSLLRVLDVTGGIMSNPRDFTQVSHFFTQKLGLRLGVGSCR